MANQNGAAEGEKCGLCMSVVNEGAIICRSCGAKRVLKNKGLAGCFIPVAVGLGVISLMLSFPMLALEGTRGYAGYAFLLAAALIGSALYLHKTAKADVYWVKS